MSKVRSLIVVAAVLFVSMNCIGFKNNFLWNNNANQFCAKNTNKLLSLLNLLCNTTQTNATARDACYGCFFRTGSLPSGPLQLASLSQCATLYLSTTNYSTCATSLAALAAGITTTSVIVSSSVCYTGYCDFVRCVRRINSNILIARCYNESVTGNPLLSDINKVFLYSNITSCILAKARCNTFNPITGEINPSGMITQSQILGKPVTVTLPTLYNSLQITPNGDLRIIAFSSVNIADYFCSTKSTLAQSGWTNVSCVT